MSSFSIVVDIAQRANVGTMYVHCMYQPVHTDLVRVVFGMKDFWTYTGRYVQYTYRTVRTINIQSHI